VTLRAASRRIEDSGRTKDSIRAAMASAISVQQLGVTFRGRFGRGGVEALRAFDCEIARGTITGVLGPNGSGKTTWLRVLAGLQSPTSGRVALLGRAPADPALRRLVAFQPDGPLPFGVLSARELLAWVGARIGLPNAESDARAARLLERLDLLHAGRRWIRTFSTGMQKRAALAAALLGDPEVLLLDEPTAGLDPLGSELVMTILRERAAAGCTVVMASHHLQEVEEICDEVVVLHEGRLRARGTLAELLGTGEHRLVVAGLDQPLLEQLAASARELGGTAVRVERERSHLFALFRRLAAGPAEGDRPWRRP
jgi:ABC-2 type transport system ATP-binding protein